MTERPSRKKRTSSSKSGRGAGGGGDYEVGYRRPPRHTQFKKGQPRPPRKPKPEAEPSFEDYMADELKLPMRFVDENGEEQVFPKGKVLAKTSVNKALKTGDIRQIKEFIPRRRVSEGAEVTQADVEMVARFLARWLPGGLADIGLANLGTLGGEAPDESGDKEDEA